MKAVLLLSGGLDSTLVAEMMVKEGIELLAVNYKTPFCQCDKKGIHGCAHTALTVAGRLDIACRVINAGEDFLKVLKDPKHGYGSHMNPCQDCRILFFKKAKEIMKELQEKEYQGYQFEGADASFELFMKRRLKMYQPFYQLEGFKVFTERKVDGAVLAGATVRLKVGGHDEMATIEGHGPVEVLDRALRTALKKFYPAVADMHLSDYKVRVLDTKQGTGAKVRVLI